MLHYSSPFTKADIHTINVILAHATQVALQIKFVNSMHGIFGCEKEIE